MNEEKLNLTVVLVATCLLAASASADPARTSVTEGNRLYTKGEFSRAIDEYDQALIHKPQAMEPKFNKANSFYRLDDLTQAMELYSGVAAESKAMKLVTRARYNLGNCHFQNGMKQRDSNLQKALEELQTSIVHWRQVLDFEPENENAAKNIEVARLIIKDIIDQINKQQDPNQPQDPNQSQQQQSQDPNHSQQQQQQQQDPNQTQDPNQQPQQQAAPDTTADEILDRERELRKQRQKMQRARYQKVEKDW
ncbi:MAG: tetratricopeptide repeat protein [Planctomycetota bacterium]